jgi:flagellar hook-length control protein FliK
VVNATEQLMDSQGGHGSGQAKESWPLPDQPVASEVASDFPTSRVTTAAAMASPGDSKGPLNPPSSDGSTLRPSEGAPVLRMMPPPQGLVLFESAIRQPGATAFPQSSPRVPEDAKIDRQIVQAIRLQWREGSGSALLTLEPEYLGTLTVSLHVEGHAVSATLHAANADVRAWLEANALVLKEGLSDQGLSLERLLIADDRPAGADEQARQRRQPPPQPPGKPAARRGEARTFEIVV